MCVEPFQGRSLIGFSLACKPILGLISISRADQYFWDRLVFPGLVGVSRAMGSVPGQARVPCSLPRVLVGEGGVLQLTVPPESYTLCTENTA